MKIFGGAAAVFCLAVSVGYLLNTPTPVDMADPWYFKLLVAGIRAGDLMTSLTLHLVPSDPHLHVRALRVMTELGLPSPDRQVRGSNLTARYAEFDGVRVLIYEPVLRGEEPIPGLVFFHGGGYALGSTKMVDPLTRRMAERLNIVIVSVEYRLAPEHPWPAAITDGVTSTRFFLQHASEYGVDPNRVVVAGDSAGGHLTAIVVQEIHDDHTVPDVKLQVHLYPMIQAFDFNTPSYQLYTQRFGSLGLSAQKVAAFAAYSYCGRRDTHFERHLVENAHTSAAFKRSYGYQRILKHDIIFEKLKNATLYGQSVDPSASLTSSRWFPVLTLPSTFISQSPSPSTVLSSPPFTYKPQEAFEESNDTFWSENRDYFLSPRFAPILREDMSGLPKAFVATGDHDLLRDDGIFYANALQQAGVEVTWRNYAGAWHGIAGMGLIMDIPTGVLMLEDAIQFIEKNI